MPDRVKEKLVELLAKYFDIGDSYAYNLTRDKRAFACGTMGFDDFEEFDEETVADIADYILSDGWTKQEWISVKDRLPETFGQYNVAIQEQGAKKLGTDSADFDPFAKQWFPTMCWGKGYQVTHWMPLPQPPKE